MFQARTQARSRIILAAGIVLIAAGAVAYLYTSRLQISHTTTSAGPSLPAVCKKPVDGYLIVASNNGYNESISHGAPTKPWPTLTVGQGQTVNIVVCNIDIQAHGFQITHYSDSNIVTVKPGESITVTFIAGQTGKFLIYCSIFCTIHVYMQSGQLVVTPS